MADTSSTYVTNPFEMDSAKPAPSARRSRKSLRVLDPNIGSSALADACDTQTSLTALAVAMTPSHSPSRNPFARDSAGRGAASLSPSPERRNLLRPRPPLRTAGTAISPGSFPDDGLPARRHTMNEVLRPKKRKSDELEADPDAHGLVCKTIERPASVEISGTVVEKNPFTQAEDAWENKAQRAKELKRHAIGREIRDTEQTYLAGLKTMDLVFRSPLLKSKILSKHEAKSLFTSELDALIQIHTELLEKLNTRLQNWKLQDGVGDLFMRFVGSRASSMIEHYTNYVNEFPKCYRIFRQLSKHNKSFSAFMDKAKTEPLCEGLDLISFLLTPVQRLPRYLLLLDNLLRVTAESHPDRTFLELAIERLKGAMKALDASFHKTAELEQELKKMQKRRKKKNASAIAFLRENAENMVTSSDASPRGGHEPVRRYSLSLAEPSPVRPNKIFVRECSSPAVLDRSCEIVNDDDEEEPETTDAHKALLNDSNTGSNSSRWTSSPDVFRPVKSKVSRKRLSVDNWDLLGLSSAPSSRRSSGGGKNLMLQFRAKIGGLTKRRHSRQQETPGASKNPPGTPTRAWMGPSSPQ
eukprot:m.307948 g.307948  ORF g.307948 m.307948 type:complete len:583 (+) comp20645_c0_seq1:69-1817(+)